jgi:hypothetical protein
MRNFFTAMPESNHTSLVHTIIAKARESSLCC